jgi:hypothetical protein
MALNNIVRISSRIEKKTSALTALCLAVLPFDMVPWHWSHFTPEVFAACSSKPSLPFFTPQ